MIQTAHDPWRDIAPSDHPDLDNVRRFDASHPLDFRRGRDFQGRYLLILGGAKALTSKPETPSLDGITVALHSGQAEFRLVLTLHDQNDLEIFRSLCHDLVSSTRLLHRDDELRGLDLVLERIRRWQDLLRRSRDGVLTLQERIGLFGELRFLSDHLLPRMPPLTAAGSWRGPYGDEQDFVLSGTIFEIKTQLASADARLQISSEHQLDLISGPIVIVHQTLSLSSEPTALTLNALVDHIKESLAGSPEGADTFRRGLIECGYSHRPEYDEESWVVVTRRCYEVREEFPRLVPGALPPGVERVRYTVTLNACAPFEVDAKALIERVINGE
jgi:hypothetical protein